MKTAVTLLCKQGTEDKVAHRVLFRTYAIVTSGGWCVMLHDCDPQRFSQCHAPYTLPNFFQYSNRIPKYKGFKMC